MMMNTIKNPLQIHVLNHALQFLSSIMEITQLDNVYKNVQRATHYRIHSHVLMIAQIKIHGVKNYLEAILQKDVK